MSEVKRRIEYVQPVEGAPPEIGRWLALVELTRQHTNNLLDQVDPAMLDWKPEWVLHSMGTLLYHIALVEADWLYVEILETPDQASYDKLVRPLLPYPVRSNNALTVVTGVSMDAHRQRLNEVRRRLLDTYQAMTLEEFRRVRVLEESDVTPEWVLYHLVEHETEHRAEMDALHTQFSKMRDNHAN